MKCFGYVLALAVMALKVVVASEVPIASSKKSDLTLTDVAKTGLIAAGTGLALKQMGPRVLKRVFSNELVPKATSSLTVRKFKESGRPFREAYKRLDPKKALKTVFQKFDGLMESYKFTTQIMAGTWLWIIGDLLSQYGEHYAATTSDKEKPFVVDKERLFRMTVYGLCFSAPAHALWYTKLNQWAVRHFARKHSPIHPLPKFLTRRISKELTSTEVVPLRRFFSHHEISRKQAYAIREKLREWEVVVTKMALDFSIFDTIYLAMFFVVTGALKGDSWDQIKETLVAKWPSAYAADVALWTPVQLVNFAKTPDQYQGLVVQIVSVLWNALLSSFGHAEH